MTSMTSALAEAVEKWLSGKSSRTLGMLARLSDTSYSTVRRLMSGEITINREKAINVASVVMANDPEALKAFIKTYWPSLNKCLVDVNFTPKSQVDVANYLASTAHLSVILLASQQNGIARKDLQDRLGDRGLEVLDELIEAGVVSMGPGNTVFLDMVPSVPSISVARQTLAGCAEAFSMGTGEGVPATAWVGWENLTPEAALQCNVILSEATEKLFAIMKNKENHGPVLVSMGALLNVLSGMEAFK